MHRIHSVRYAFSGKSAVELQNNQGIAAAPSLTSLYTREGFSFISVFSMMDLNTFYIIHYAGYM